jgi:hypothetical protein
MDGMKTMLSAMVAVGMTILASGVAQAAEGGSERAIEIREAVKNFQEQRKTFLATQQELVRSNARANQEQRAAIREELARNRQDAAALRRDLRESVQNARAQAVEQSRRVSVEVRAEVGRGRD